MSPLQWTETLEVGDPVTFKKFEYTVPITVMVERVTIQKIYLSNGSVFPRFTNRPTGYPRIEPYKAESKNKLKAERKRKVLCQKLARFDWSQLTLDQVQIIHAYLKQGEPSDGS